MTVPPIMGGKCSPTVSVFRRYLKKDRDNHTGKNKIDGLRKNGCRRSCHASGGKLRTKSTIECRSLLKGINSLLPGDIVVKRPDRCG